MARGNISVLFAIHFWDSTCIDPSNHLSGPSEEPWGLFGPSVCNPPPTFPCLASPLLVEKSCAWVLWLFNKVLLAWPGVTQWPLGPLRSTHVYSEEKELRYSMQPGGSEPTLMPNQTFHLFQPRIKYGVTCEGFDPTSKVRWLVMCKWEEKNIFFLFFFSTLFFLWVRLRLTQSWPV